MLSLIQLLQIPNLRAVFSTWLNMRISAFAATAALLLFTVAMATPVELTERSDELEDVFFARGPGDGNKNINIKKNIDIKQKYQTEYRR